MVYNRHSESGDVQKWSSPNDIDIYLSKFKQHSLNNPIVEQVVTETLRVVRDIWQSYGNGEKDFFDEIHVELGREMKNPAKKREAMSKKNTENENTNHRIKEILKELMNDNTVEGNIKYYSPSHQEILKIYEEGIWQNPNADFSKMSEEDIIKIRNNKSPKNTKKPPTINDIQKYRLWLEQGYISPYTGNLISLSRLFTTDYQIEHIIPQSRYFDNSLSNKVICESDVNVDKGNKTAYEYIKEKGGSIVSGFKLFTLDSYESHVNKYFKKNSQKLKNLLSEDIPEGFINRQLNDSRYISKLIKGLLSNIVREDGEQEATSKNLIPVTGAVTSKLKQDWGLNDKWNELIAPRFKRLNKITKQNQIKNFNEKILNKYPEIELNDLNIYLQKFERFLDKNIMGEFGFWDKNINAFRTQVPNEISKGFSKKRIDHRHHALDALVVACTTRNHTHYLGALNAENKNYSLRDKLLIKNKQGDYTKSFQHPWGNFTIDAKNNLEKAIISFKQNTRVINKTNNTYWSYKDENGKLNVDKNGKPVKKLRKQIKGDNWAIRKSLHKETVSGLYNIETAKGKVATSVRTHLSSIKNEKHLAKVTDKNIKEVILPNHLNNYLDEKGKPNYELAFSEEGIEDLNNNIKFLNNGKTHHSIFKVKLYEEGSKFKISEDENSPKNKKFVEAAKGTNLFFAIYWDEKKKKRNYDTVPLNEVIAHQKTVAHLPKEVRKPIQPKPGKGTFLFTLSPNDLVYVPTDEEIENPQNLDFDNLTKEQVERIYKMVSCTGSECHFVPARNSFEISKNENGTNSKNERVQDFFDSNCIYDTKDKPIMIKERCWKLQVSRLGKIEKILK